MTSLANSLIEALHLLVSKIDLHVFICQCPPFCLNDLQNGTGLDIGYVPAGPDAFFKWSGQFGPQQLIFYCPPGPFFIFF